MLRVAEEEAEVGRRGKGFWGGAGGRARPFRGVSWVGRGRQGWGGACRDRDRDARGTHFRAGEPCMHACQIHVLDGPCQYGICSICTPNQLVTMYLCIYVCTYLAMCHVRSSVDNPATFASQNHLARPPPTSWPFAALLHAHIHTWLQPAVRPSIRP